MEEKTVEVNGQTLTESQLQEKKEEISKQKGVVLVEVSKDVYRTRLNDWQLILKIVFSLKGIKNDYNKWR